ncbi:MAG: FtsX-like permease family protein [Pseudomonadota bacterium]
MSHSHLLYELSLSVRMLWRNWRAGELKILATAITLAVTVVTAIAVFTDRMDRSLVRQSNSYLAADRVVESRFPIPDQWLQAPAARGLAQGQTAEFSSMVFAGEGGQQDMQLASIKAVSDHYPLRGQVEISDQAYAPSTAIYIAEGVPAKGQVWVDSRLLSLLGIELGDNLAIGERSFQISKVLIREPDTGTAFTLLGPRILLNMEDLQSTAVILPGSRVTYRWLLAGEENQLRQFADWIEGELGEHYRLITLQEAQQNIGLALDRGSQFLLLAAVIAVLLAGVAISIAAQHFANRHIGQVALLKSLGADGAYIRRLYIWQLLLLGLLAAVVGIVLGEVLQWGIALTLASLFRIELLPAPVWIYSLGLVTGLICLLGFVLPPLWHLPAVPPLKILRRELSVSPLSQWLKGLLGLGAISLLIWFYSGNTLLTLSVLAGLVVIVAICALLALLLLCSGHQLGTRAGSVWRLAVANLRRYQQQTLTQILVFACALMLLMVLFTMRSSLIDEWRLQLPEDAPNHFMLNIAPYERANIETLLADNNLQPSPMYPMVLGRLTHKNDYAFTEDDRALSNTLRRELNLSWSQTLAEDNKLIAGQWWDRWQHSEAGFGVSVEYDTAKELDIALGDRLGFSLGGLNLEAEVASIRSVDWGAMTPNFYFLFSPGTLANYSPNYLSSVYIPQQQKPLINQLLRAYPTVVVLEVDRIIERIRAIVSQVSRAIELVLWLVLLGGVLVLMSAVNASMSNRLQEAGILRALGSGRALIAGSLWIEFALLGGFAGMLAVVGTEVLLMSLQYFVFDQDIRPHYTLWLLGPLLGASFVGMLGWLSCLRILKVPPGVVLRELEH